MEGSHSILVSTSTSSKETLIVILLLSITAYSHFTTLYIDCL